MGLFPLVFAAAGMSLAQIGLLAAFYPAVWSIGQLVTGALSDRIGRKQLIVWGMWVQAAGIGVIAMAQGFGGFLAGGLLLVSAPRWCIPRCSQRLVMSRTRRGGHRLSASIACGATLAMPSVRCWPASRLILRTDRRALGHRRAYLRVRRGVGSANVGDIANSIIMTRHIDTATLRDWLEQDRPVTVLDIRSDDDRGQWAIPGSVHINAYDALRKGEPGPLQDCGAAFGPARRDGVQCGPDEREGR